MLFRPSHTACAYVCLSAALLWGSERPRQVEFFETKIRPILGEHCYECHSADAKHLRGGLRLDSREGARAGGESGPAVVPGRPDESLLLEALRYESFEMPPSGPLPAHVVADFQTWIAAGAVDPRDAPAHEDKAVSRAAGIDIAAGREYWSFQPPQRHALPELRRTNWPYGEIDRFVLARMESAGLDPATDADRRTLIRRAYFDLIGLPPPPDAIAAFLADAATTPIAFERLVERLLGSPHFGERWGRHWLDVARFAESTGGARSMLFGSSWRYRDYVIHSFNADKPFDRFIIEQIAGDLLPYDDHRQGREQHIATAFLALGPTNYELQDKEQLRMDVVDEQIDTVGRAFLGMTLGCARCHDHKFDPVPTTDYYALAGIFRSTKSLIHDNVSKWVSRSLPVDSKLQVRLDEHAAAVAEIESQIAARSGQLDALNEQLPTTSDTDESSRSLAESSSGISNLLTEISDLKSQISNLASEISDLKSQISNLASEISDLKSQISNLPSEISDLKSQSSNLPSGISDLKSQISILQSEISDLKSQLARLNKRAPPSPPEAIVVAEEPPGEIGDYQICIRGNPKNLGAAVPRGFLTVATTGPMPLLPDDSSGRLELARWIADPSHPLTARVTANRVWHHLFGAGLVRTVDNFGLAGEQPSHPELLDHLAIYLTESGFSIKSLIREIMLSRTYQLASTPPATSRVRDPENRLLSHQNRRRLDAEAIHDAILSVGGQLDLTIGGDTVRGGTKSEYGYEFAFGRRAVYLPVFRNRLPDLFVVFDFPDPNLSIGRRAVSTLPTQALLMMNSPFVMDQARHTAERSLANTEISDRQRLDLLYNHALGRQPSELERRLANDFIGVSSQASESDRRAGWTSLAQAVIASVDFRYVK